MPRRLIKAGAMAPVAPGPGGPGRVTPAERASPAVAERRPGRPRWAARPDFLHLSPWQAAAARPLPLLASAAPIAAQGLRNKPLQTLRGELLGGTRLFLGCSSR